MAKGKKAGSGIMSQVYLIALAKSSFFFPSPPGGGRGQGEGGGKKLLRPLQNSPPFPIVILRKRSDRRISLSFNIYEVRRYAQDEKNHSFARGSWVMPLAW
jgi:hypothetical protein